MTLLTLGLLMIVMGILAPLIRRLKRYISKMNKIPGPKSYHIIGNLLEAMQPLDNLLQRIEDMFAVHRNIFAYWLGPLPMVFVRQPRHLEVILGSSKCMRKPYAYRFMKPYMGNGLITSRGQKWHIHRKMITPAFFFNILDSFLPVFARNSETLAKNLEMFVEKEGFNLQEHVNRCALNIICETAMGYKLNSQHLEDSEYMKATNRFTRLVMKRSRNALYYPDIIFWHTNVGKQFKKCVETMKLLTNSVLSEKKQLIKYSNASKMNRVDLIGSKQKKAFLDLLLEIEETGGNLTDKDVCEEVHTFMTAGHETTTVAICWTLQMLGVHTEVQEKVYEELENIFQRVNHFPTMQDLNAMKCLERVIKETLRLYPPVPLIARLATEDITLDEITVPAGSTLVIPIYSIHRNPAYFDNPAMFDPGRFLPERAAKRHPYAYLPFSAGPRNCIGHKFVMLEMKMVLAYILLRYKVYSLRNDLNLLPSITLQSKQGFFCILSKRLL